MGTVITAVKTAIVTGAKAIAACGVKVATSAWSFACAHPIIVCGAIVVCVGLVVYKYCSETKTVTTAPVSSSITAIEEIKTVEWEPL